MATDVVGDDERLEIKVFFRSNSQKFFAVECTIQWTNSIRGPQTMPFYSEELQQAKDRADREEAVRHAIGSARIEGIEISDETLDVLKQWEDGEISTEDMRRWREDVIRRFKEKANSPNP